ncbi:MAG: hypothetical protein V4628_01210 [Pseudomonadota bacterium]
MSKLMLVIKNGEDGNPLWEEAEIRQVRTSTKPAQKSPHQDRRETFAIDEPHYSKRKYRMEANG